LRIDGVAGLVDGDVQRLDAALTELLPPGDLDRVRPGHLRKLFLEAAERPGVVHLHDHRDPRRVHSLQWLLQVHQQAE
jgi:hypothetical protein